MKNLRFIFVFAICCCSFVISYSQDFLGYSNSNYAGVSGIDLNPASIADSRYMFDMTLAGANFSVANNYIALTPQGRKFLFSKDTGSFDKNKFLYENTNSTRKSAFVSAQGVLPSFMLTLSPKSAIAVTIRARAMVNVDGLDEPLAHQLYEGLGDSTLYKRQFQNKNINIGAMDWMEYGVTYSRVLVDSKQHFLKAGLRIKYLQGISAAYLSLKNFSYNFPSDSTLTANTQANYGHSNSFSLNNTMTQLQMASKPSFGLDLGVDYEWRPDAEKYFYDMDGKTHLPMRYKNKYKLKAGFSVLDIGRLKFEQTTVGDFSMDKTNWYIGSLHGNSNNSPTQNLDSILQANASIKESQQSFKMHLPTVISSQIDYNIWKDFYANFTAYYAFQFTNAESKVHELTTFSLTPRWDWKWFGVFVPFSYNQYQMFKTGLSLRLGPLVVGTTNLGPFIGKKDIYGMDFHVLLKVPIMYGRVKDRDGDHVSNKKDKCPDVPGTWEFMGCPDRDGDHIPDNLDSCPDIPGLPQFSGCPDRDGDGIPDKRDSCPDVAGLAQFHGCPDKDGDGIIDKKDSCPDDAGLPQFNGCPDRDHDGVPDKEDLCPNDSGSVATHGCPDRDGDGVLDKDDRCPDKPGPKENDGCPLSKLNLLDAKGNIIASATIDKDGKFHFTELPSDEKVLFQLESYDVLVVNEVTVASGKIFRVARRGVDGYFHFENLASDANKLGKLDIADTQIKLKTADALTVKEAMENLEFDFGKGVIRSSSNTGLDKLVDLLKKNPTWRLKLSGHTDNVSSQKFNMALSQKRVESVKKYLVSKGISAGHIVLKWYGSSKPIATNATDEGRQKNRRVEFLIIQ